MHLPPLSINNLELIKPTVWSTSIVAMSSPDAETAAAAAAIHSFPLSTVVVEGWFNGTLKSLMISLMLNDLKVSTVVSSYLPCEQ